MSNEELTNPRQGSTLEGRVSVLLRRKGYRTENNRIILSNEIDVWGEDDEGRVALVECKEYYQTGPVTPSVVRDFFGKVYDIRTNHGENVYLTMFVTINTFTEAASALCERLGILAVDGNKLIEIESNNEELKPYDPSYQDKVIIDLQKENSVLQKEIERRNLIKRLSQNIQNYKSQLDTRTLPPFLEPANVSREFWYSSIAKEEVPFLGVDGQIEDFLCYAYPYVEKAVFCETRFLRTKSTVCYNTEHLDIDMGTVKLIRPIDENGKQLSLRDLKQNIPKEQKGLEISAIKNCSVMTVDKTKIGYVDDVLIAKETDWFIKLIKVKVPQNIARTIDIDEFTISSSYCIIKYDEEGYITFVLYAHYKG